MMNEAVEIPMEVLETASLRALVEAFVTREGTDYGSAEVALATKVDQVIAQISSGRARILWDSELESFDIRSAG
ncbi:MAG: YheU family protein [Gammaproteobacteria bacterium]|nr:YheU family protein [Gammaproteobacteria bacterium]